MDIPQLTTEIKQEARRNGFDLVGVCPAVSSPGFERFRDWLRAGYDGQMHYLASRADAYEHPDHVLQGVRSLVMLGMNYATTTPGDCALGQGRVSRYAWGTADYHDVIHDRLRSLCKFVQDHHPQAAVRGVVDTAPLLEREFAQLAGLGWIGKNTLLLNKQAGSWFFLAALLTDLELQADQPFETDHCGTCRACLDACPTDAFPQPYVLDATKCISYLTIELRDSIPQPLRSGMGDWLFGCDICQDVCPWNRHAPASDEAAFLPQRNMGPVDLTELFLLDDAAFRARFRHTPLWRSKRRGLLRNAAIVLGNRPTDRAIDALIRGLQDNETLVRGASAWALGRRPSATVLTALEAQRANESDDGVLREIDSAIASVQAAYSQLP